MSMKVSPIELKDIANKVTALDSTGVEVEKIHMYGHEVFLAQEGGKHIIVGISEKRQKGGGVTR